MIFLSASSFRPFLPIALCFLAAGCTLDPPEGIRVESTINQKVFSEKYSTALVNRIPGGDYHILLIDDGSHAKQLIDPEAPMRPLVLASVRQIMHIHIFWRPMRAQKPDSPSATNSAIDWYLVRADKNKIIGLVHYEGAGLVDIDISGGQASIIIRGASLRPTLVAGEIKDPIGPMRIIGSTDATYAPTAVEDVLKQLEELKSGGITSNVDAVRLTEPSAHAAGH